MVLMIPAKKLRLCLVLRYLLMRLQLQKPAHLPLSCLLRSGPQPASDRRKQRAPLTRPPGEARKQPATPKIVPTLPCGPMQPGGKLKKLLPGQRRRRRPQRPPLNQEAVCPSVLKG